MFMDFVIIITVIYLFLYIIYRYTHKNIHRPNKRYYPYNDKYSKKIRTN